MANAELNNSTHWVGEPIRGHFVITVDEVDPAIPAISVLNAALQMMVKDDKSKPNNQAIATLTVGSGLTVTTNTSLLYDVIYRIPGSATALLTPANDRDPSVTLYYEISITYQGDTESDVLESGKFKIKTDRVRKP